MVHLRRKKYNKYKDYYSEDGYTLLAKHKINTTTSGMTQLRDLRREFRDFITANFQNKNVCAEYLPTKRTAQQIKNAFISKQQRSGAFKRMQDQGKRNEHHAIRVNIEKARINRAIEEEIRLMKTVRMLEAQHHDLKQFANRLCHIVAPNMDADEWIRLDSAHSSTTTTTANTAMHGQVNMHNFASTGMSLAEPQSIVKHATYVYKEVAGVPKVFCEHKLDCSQNFQNNAGRQLTRGQDDKNVSESGRLRKHSTNDQHNASIANYLTPTLVLRSNGSATTRFYGRMVLQRTRPIV